MKKTFLELVREAESKIDGYIEFDGQNCNDYGDVDPPCEGWDGQDRRCQCGNRRVSWEQIDDETVVPTAY